nr:ShlB/FhaC/HecB family hemolysin secretion/activation protein [Rosenbergiella australiborealis]
MLLALWPLSLTAQSEASTSSLDRGSLLIGQQRQAPSLPESDQALIHQQNQQRALEQRLALPEPTIRLALPNYSAQQQGFPQENPCFPLTTITLSGGDAFPRWLQLQRIANTAAGQCLGSQGINLLMRRLQNRLVDQGYVTTRVLAPEQDLTQGVLRLTFVPGKIRQLKMAPHSHQGIFLSTAFPGQSGALVDLRDLEQGLENLQRLPTTQASMEIVAADQPGESDIVVNWQQSRKWRLGLSVDDSGTRSTGRYQAGATLYLDNPLKFSDSLYLNAGKALLARGGKGTHNYTGQYTLPYGYWQAGLTGSYNDYYQTIAGAYTDYRYRGQSQQLALQLGRIIHRGTQHKTRLTGEVSMRQSKNFIDDTAIDNQHRKTTSWKATLHHQHYLKTATVDLVARYQQGTRWFGALPAGEETFGEATALSHIVQITADLTLPFTIGTQQFRYNLLYQQQFTSSRLTPPEQFSIGGRWTVRGFDGERSLSADKGRLVRTEWSWSTPITAQQLYLGLDYGDVWGRSSTQLLGHHLAGSVLGVRGRVLSTAYDTFIGVPLSAPPGFRQDPVTFGFTVNWVY